MWFNSSWMTAQLIAARPVTIATQNRPPLANAGPDQSAPLQATVELDGSASSGPDNDPLIFNWSILSKPTGSATPYRTPRGEAVL